MPKRKRSDHDGEEYIRRKLRKLERKLNRRRKVRAGSNHSSTSSVYYQLSPVPSHHQDVNLEKAPEPEEVIELIETQPMPQPQPELQCESSSGQNKLADVPDVQPSSSDVTPIDAAEPEIDEEIMMLLGEAPSKDKKYGPDIQKDIAIRWEHISTSGLPKEARKELLEKHLTPDNCKKIEAPLLNPEIKAALSEALLKKDKAIENKQKQYTAAISCVGQALTLLLSSEHKDPQIIKLMIEAGRIMCDSQFCESMARRGFIGSMIRKELRDQLYDTEIDKYLYGEKLSETLKAAKAINKSATDMKLPMKASAPKNKQTAPPKNSRPQYPNSRPPAAPRRADPPSAQYLPPPRRRAPQPPPPPQPRYQPRAPPPTQRRG